MSRRRSSRALRWVLRASLALVPLAPSLSAAQEGESHLAMGWVRAITSERLDLEDTEGKRQSFLLDAQTRFLRGQQVERPERIAVGERAVVRYEERGGLKAAKEIRVAEAAVRDREPPPEHRHPPEAEPAQPEHRHGETTPEEAVPAEPEHEHPGMVEAGEGHSGMEHAGMETEMTGRFGGYPLSREASGTAWQPDSTPHGGLHWMRDPWMLMAHGYADLVWDDQGGKRGDEKFFSGNMGMLMAQRRLGPGTFGLRAMLSLDPATIGKEGYPLLFQTGETADGRTPLIDRQHPHDFFMELAASYSVEVSEQSSVFGYLGYPGEPALGPPVFMHRFSGQENPEAPLGHHWLDSTHITFGAATLGWVWQDFKLEGSLFTGREPDSERWNFDPPEFDSYSARLSWNPTPDWSLQASWGRLESPEELEPEEDTDRTTASASYNYRWSKETLSQTTLAWGRNRSDPGPALDAFLLETTVVARDRHVLFGRLEWDEKDELFEEEEPLAHHIFEVGKATLGYRYDWPLDASWSIGLGALASAYDLPGALEPAYGSSPTSYMIFSRIRVR